MPSAQADEPEYHLVGWADWQTAEGTTVLNCHVALIDREGTVNDPSTVTVTDPGAQVTIDECALYRGEELMLTSSTVAATGPVAQTVPTVGNFTFHGIVACYSAHAVLSSGEVLSKRECY